MSAQDLPQTFIEQGVTSGLRVRLNTHSRLFTDRFIRLLKKVAVALRLYGDHLSPQRSRMIEPLQTSLQSFVNSYKAVMWRLRECALNDEQLASAIGVSSSVIRSRRSKPDLWKLSDINRLSSYFSMPTTACIQLDHLLKQMPQQWTHLPLRERRRYERLLPVKKSQIQAYNLSDWPVHHLLKMHQNLILNDELAS